MTVVCNGQPCEPPDGGDCDYLCPCDCHLDEPWGRDLGGEG